MNCWRAISRNSGPFLDNKAPNYFTDEFTIKLKYGQKFLIMHNSYYGQEGAQNELKNMTILNSKWKLSIVIYLFWTIEYFIPINTSNKSNWLFSEISSTINTKPTELLSYAWSSCENLMIVMVFLNKNFNRTFGTKSIPAKMEQAVQSHPVPGTDPSSKTNRFRIDELLNICIFRIYIELL
jgi:hypothetical protein